MSDSGESETFHGNSAWLALREEQYGNQCTETAGHAPQPVRTQSLGGTHVLHAFIDGAAAALRPQPRVERVRGTHGKWGGCRGDRTAARAPQVASQPRGAPGGSTPRRAGSCARAAARR